MRSTRIICVILSLFVMCTLFTGCAQTKEENNSIKEDMISCYFKTHGSMFSVWNEDIKEYEDIYIKGVNIGSGKPGYFPGESAITYEEYENWFNEIAEMNANCVRVYTIQSPDFYKALYFHNQAAEEPIYFFQGTWYDEDSITNTWDAYDPYLYETLLQDEEDIVDAIHGNITIAPRAGKAYGEYICDVSKYCIGWILGIESEAEFVRVTAEKHPEKTEYQGAYLSVFDVTPYETFWAETGDHVITYEMEKYHMQRPVSFTNWPTTDVLSHESITANGVENDEDNVSLTVEDIKPTEAFTAGLFASYHIYPYYPNFMYTDQKYAEYVDKNGNPNTYEAYLKDLIKEHTVPVLVAEFGVPSSRGMAHVNEVTGITQGRISEETQGKYLVQMAQDIQECGYCGELIFSWQDEWFKKTWNTEQVTNKNRRAYWDDVETNEQSFGLVDYRASSSDILLDGDKSDWKLSDLFQINENHRLSVAHDEAYLYLYVRNMDIKTDRVVVGFDVSKTTGCKEYEGISFKNDIDFVLDINGFDNTRLMVQKESDRFLYEFQNDYEVQADYLKNPGEFNPVYKLMERTISYKDRTGGLRTQYYEAGHLIYGTEKEQKHLADFCATEDGVEIRIPWGLLNFRDPSTKEIDAEYTTAYIKKETSFTGTTIDGIGIGFSEYGSTKEVPIYTYTWENWDHPIYTETLKDSYYAIQEYYGTIP